MGACREHHSFVDTNPNKKEIMFMQMLGYDKYERLRLLSNQNCKLMPSDLEEINKNLKNELKTYQ